MLIPPFDYLSVATTTYNKYTINYFVKKEIFIYKSKLYLKWAKW